MPPLLRRESWRCARDGVVTWFSATSKKTGLSGATANCGGRSTRCSCVRSAVSRSTVSSSRCSSATAAVRAVAASGAGDGDAAPVSRSASALTIARRPRLMRTRRSAASAPSYAGRAQKTKRRRWVSLAPTTHRGGMQSGAYRDCGHAVLGHERGRGLGEHLVRPCVQRKRLRPLLGGLVQPPAVVQPVGDGHRTLGSGNKDGGLLADVPVGAGQERTALDGACQHLVVVEAGQRPRVRPVLPVPAIACRAAAARRQARPGRLVPRRIHTYLEELVVVVHDVLELGGLETAGGAAARALRRRRRRRALCARHKSPGEGPVNGVPEPAPILLPTFSVHTSGNALEGLRDDDAATAGERRQPLVGGVRMHRPQLRGRLLALGRLGRRRCHLHGTRRNERVQLTSLVNTA